MSKRKNRKTRIKEKQVRMKNRRIVREYPWLAPKSLWTGKLPDDYDFSYIEWGCARGWDIAFGDMYMKELGYAVKEAGIENEFMIEQIKEKYGQLRLYASPMPETVERIIMKYERLSENVCISCGKPDVPVITKGWISPLCFECYKKSRRKSEKWSLEHRPDFVPASDETLLSDYENSVEGSERRMADNYSVRKSFPDGRFKDEFFDISETAEAIRKRYEKRVRKTEKHKRKHIGEKAGSRKEN